MQRKIGRAALLLMAVFMLSSCGSGGGGADSGGTGTGTLSLSMTDASSDQYEAVYVTVDEIQVHLGGSDGNPSNWKPLTMQRSPITVDLLKLTNGVREQLGLVDLPTGTYTQVRLITGEVPEDKNLPYANYVVDKSTPANIYQLKIPSGTNTGFKIVENFTIEKDQTLELVLDFDANRSVIQAGNSGQWLLKPTVKIDNLVEASIVSGQVTDVDGTTVVSNALVSAQQYNGAPNDEKDRVMVQASTVTDKNGEYALFLKPDTYNIVAISDGKKPLSQEIATDAGETKADVNFKLEDAVESEVAGTVLISGASTENYATLSFRQGTGTDTIEIKSVNVANGTDYSIDLPVGDYNLVASSFGYSTKTKSLQVPVVPPEDASVSFP